MVGITLIDVAVDFRKWLRVLRGDAGVSSATPVGTIANRFIPAGVSS